MNESGMGSQPDSTNEPSWMIGTKGQIIRMKKVWVCLIFMANICCPIELEPRTLNQGQLNQAREVAADAVQKPREASALLIQGFVHVNPREGMKEMDEGGDQVDKLVECMEKARIIDDKICQCSCTVATIESPEQFDLKEPHSAPF